MTTDTKMNIDERCKYLRIQQRHYAAAQSQRAKQALLDEMERVTGLNRKHLIQLLGQAGIQRHPRSRERERAYGPEVDEALALIWEAQDYICAERLQSILVGHLTRMCPFLDDGRAPTDRAMSASTGAAQGVTVLAAARASHSPFPAPLKRCRMAGPVVRGGLQPRDDILGSMWILPRHRAVYDDPLNRLTHVQPRPTQRRIQRHDATGHQPQYQVGDLCPVRLSRISSTRKRCQFTGVNAPPI